MVLFVYCKLHFKESLLQTGVGIFFLSTLITICQFVCAVVTCVLLPEAEQIRPVLINVGVLSFNLWMLPRFKLNIFKKNIENTDVVSIEFDISKNPEIFAYDKYINVLSNKTK